MINYSAIKHSPKAHTPWDSLKISLVITLSILAAMGLGGLVSFYIGKSDTVMATISGLFVLGFITVVVRSFIISSRGFADQKRQMELFAGDNGWKYDDSKRDISALAAFPASLGVTPEASNVRSTVTGDYDGIVFELAHVTYVQSTGLWRRLNYGQRGRFAWVSVLSLEGHPPLQKQADLIYDKDASHTFVICPLNAYYLKDIKAMFDSFVTAEQADK